MRLGDVVGENHFWIWLWMWSLERLREAIQKLFQSLLVVLTLLCSGMSLV